MRVVAETSVAAFADRVLPFLLRDAVRNNVAAQQIMTRATGDVPTEDDALWLAAYRDEELESVALRTPPNNLLLTAAGTEAVTALTDWCAEHAPNLPGVNGPIDAADAFAAGWRERTGTRVRVATASRLFRLDKVTLPRPVTGTLRLATSGDAALIREWIAAFFAEAAPHENPSHIAEMVDRKLSADDLWLWTDGEPVSMLWTNPPAAGAVRVSGVFTPPAHRGHGYASASVAHISQILLDRGTIPCLYTDLANPTSNKIYQAIGYRPVQDARQWIFETRT